MHFSCCFCMCLCVCVQELQCHESQGPQGPQGTPESGARLEFCSPDITAGLQIKAYYGQLAESLQVRPLYRRWIYHLLVALMQGALCSAAATMGGPDGNQSHISVRVTRWFFPLNHLNDSRTYMRLEGRLGGSCVHAHACTRTRTHTHAHTHARKRRI